MDREPGHVDVTRIMRQIRDEARARHGEIERRIDRARRELADRFPQLSDEQLGRHVGTLTSLFDRYYDRVAAFLREQEPNYANIRYTLSEINRVLGEGEPARGRFDRWWNPRFWLKKALGPVRRFVLRHQQDLNALVRDTLIYLVNHSGHVELQRMELEMAVQLVRAMGELLKQIEATRQYFRELPGVSQRPIFEHVGETLERFGELQKQEQERVSRAEREHVREQMDRFCRESGALLARLERRIGELAPARAAEAVGFDTLGLAETVRGEEAALGQRQARYLQHLRGRENILDAGCGRGELLALLRDEGIAAYGVDVDENMVRQCRRKGLDARFGDVLDHLAALPDASLGGLVALQLIEHFDFPRLAQFFRHAGQKMRQGGIVILETVNPSCLTVFSGAFYADPSHHRPIHPQAAKRMLEMVGFGDVQVDYLNPVPDGDKLSCLTHNFVSDPTLKHIVEALNMNIERLNSVLYGFADYAVIGHKTAGS